MRKEDILCERIIAFFESYMIYLCPTIKLTDFARILEVEESYLEEYFKKEVEYSFEEMLSIFRITHATDLLIKESVPYNDLWMICGFKSHEDFELAFQSLAI